MKVKTHLVINSRGTGRLTKTPPNLSWDEIAIGLTLTIPDELFSKPKIEAAIVIPKEAVMSKTISAEMTDNIQKAIQTAAGLQVELRVVEPEENNHV